MNLSEQYEDAKLELQISPLIDVVFLLLIYFIVTAQIVKKEGDIPFMLPADVPTMEMIDIPVEARIKINPDESVMVEGMTFGPSDRNLRGLVEHIVGLRVMAERQHSPFFVTLDPNKDTKHRRIIDVMDACAEANVKNLTFAKRGS
ncbi:MAG: biopolymer transporter ExbD [Pontiellaceae bacterium]|nr:biopolymer transporter ExbD [Pontiellaceae bacterium]MBN2784258.1 biopolymer transporter ExbD [Pontiellaceae bacterium]